MQMTLKHRNWIAFELQVVVGEGLLKRRCCLMRTIALPFLRWVKMQYAFWQVLMV